MKRLLRPMVIAINLACLAVNSCAQQPQLSDGLLDVKQQCLIGTFLKEHLFADMFGRDILTYKEREIATISALIALGGVEPMMQGHFRIAMHTGITRAQLHHLLSVIETNLGKQAADSGRRILSSVTNSADKNNESNTPPEKD